VHPERRGVGHLRPADPRHTPRGHAGGCVVDRNVCDFFRNGLHRARLPSEDFLAQLKLGLAHSAFAWQQWKEAESRYDEILSTLHDADGAPEALYWLGVSRYKSSGDATALQQTAEAFKNRYTDSTWAKKSSVWAK
jgi:hypothetical protein